MKRIAPALIVALGMALAGWFVGDGFYLGRVAERYVTVKGVSERQVRADVALWQLRFVATDDDLGKALASIRASEAGVREFLQRQGLAADQADVLAVDVKDRLADPYRTGPMGTRFIITQTMMVRSDDPGLVESASQAVGSLVESGVVLAAAGGPATGPTYLFTGLNELKPEMIAEATANARRAGEQFAQDSGSRLGRIRRANQGVFQILARDQAPGVSQGGQPDKTVRVVSTIEYYLED
jgi:hypothetical protein